MVAVRNAMRQSCKMRSVDTIVIGAGIAGLSLAARCAMRGSVVVLEAESAVGYHSSGRSVAHAHFGLGDDIIRALTAISMDRLAEIPNDGSASAATLHPTLHIASAEYLAALDELERQHQRIGRSIRRLDSAAAQAIVPILRSETVAAALLDETSLKLDADAMLQGHVRSIRTNGGEIVARSPVLSMALEGDRWIVDTAASSYRTRSIVNAAGAWAEVVAQMAGIA